ncbi:MAG: alpha/beta fold hydrolase [Candidatus Rokuibacteriota bacterium]
MATIRTGESTEIYYKDWGTGRPIVFSHGWPLNADMWEYQMTFLAAQGFRCVAHDRRGFGRSSQPWTGYEYDTFAEDLSTLIEALDLKDITLVGFSMGGGEVARYIGRQGTKRVSKAVLIGAVPPLLLKTADHPEGVDRTVFDGLRAGISADRPQFFADFGKVFMGANRPGAKVVSPGVLDWTFFMAMQASLKGTLDCVAAFSETDFRPDLKAFDVPTLVIHGDDDQVVPLEITGRASAKAIPGARLQVYKGAPHGLCFTHKDQINADLLAFLKS